MPRLQFANRRRNEEEEAGSQQMISHDNFDERASLLTATSVSAPTNYPTTDYIGLDDTNDDDWEDISLPTSSLKDRILYWTCRTAPALLCDAFRLAVFILFLLPAFVSFFYNYVTCDRQVVRYMESNSRRHVVDIYGANQDPKKDQSRKPVLIFFTGGAWMIGYKMWGAFLAKVFAAVGVLVVIPDYPNYPLVTVPQMVQDSEAAIQWTLDEIEKYGGDPKRVMLAGQSAGGHLSSCVLLRKALQALRGQVITGFQPKDLAGFCCISSPSDVQAMSTNFQKHGLDNLFIQSLFGVRGNQAIRMDDYDPQRLVEQIHTLLSELDDNQGLDPPTNRMSQILPPMSIFHGTADQTVPYEVSERFAASLLEVGITTEYIEYEGWSHTDPILEAIMDADHRFHADLYDRLYEWTGGNNPLPKPHLDDTIPECKRLCPAPMIRLARFCNPF